MVAEVFLGSKPVQAHTPETIVDFPILMKAEKHQRLIDRKNAFPAELQDPNADALKRRESLQAIPRLAVPEEYAPEVNRIVNEMWEVAGRKPVSERLLEISHLVNAAVENHLLRKNDEEWTKKQDIKGNIGDQKSWKNWQGVAKATGGFGSAILSIVGAAVPEPIGGVLSGISRMTPNMSDTAATLVDGFMIELSHEQSLYLNTVQSDKQGKQGLTQMMQQYRSMILELVRLELQASKETFQR